MLPISNINFLGLSLGLLGLALGLWFNGYLQ